MGKPASSFGGLQETLGPLTSPTHTRYIFQYQGKTPEAQAIFPIPQSAGDSSLIKMPIRYKTSKCLSIRLLSTISRPADQCLGFGALICESGTDELLLKMADSGRAAMLPAASPGIKSVKQAASRIPWQPHQLCFSLLFFFRFCIIYFGGKYDREPRA